MEVDGGEEEEGGELGGGGEKLGSLCLRQTKKVPWGFVFWVVAIGRSQAASL